MSFVGIFLMLVVGIGFAELYLLTFAAHAIGFLYTLALCIFTGILGGALVRRQGLQTLMAIQKAMARGEMPAVEVVSGLALLIVGALLITPGFITDTIGFIMLVPFIRLSLSGKLAKHLAKRIQLRQFDDGADGSKRGKIIDIDPE